MIMKVKKKVELEGNRVETKTDQILVMNTNSKKRVKKSTKSTQSPVSSVNESDLTEDTSEGSYTQDRGDPGCSKNPKNVSSSSSTPQSSSKAQCGGNEDGDRAEITLWRRPFTTLYYFILEIPCSVVDAKDKFAMSLYDPDQRSIPLRRRVFILLTLLGFIYGLYFMMVKEDPKSLKIKEVIMWYAYWTFLGILSSVGLGTGLHTFLLYLGPFIAKVTLAAQECGSVQFPRPPYPDQYVRIYNQINLYQMKNKIHL